jgi:hypothetical protein
MTESRFSMANLRIGLHVLLILLVAPVGVLAPVADAPGPGVPADWLGKVTDDIRRTEYRFTRQEDGGFLAPNRAYDLRVRVSGNGIEIVSRTRGEDPGQGGWKLWLALKNVSQAQPSAGEDRVELKRGALTEWYVNTEKGLEQGFTIERQPERDDPGSPVVVKMALSGGLSAKLSEDGQAITFTGGSGEPALRCGELQVHDAGGRALDARLEISTRCLGILINDEGAICPITVDPLMRSPAWTAEGNQASAYFGNAVATAGDVNGDGYSDVIVGAPLYDNGETDEGRASVYYGNEGEGGRERAHRPARGCKDGRRIPASGKRTEPLRQAQGASRMGSQAARDAL